MNLGVHITGTVLLLLGTVLLLSQVENSLVVLGIVTFVTGAILLESSERGRS